MVPAVKEERRMESQPSSREKDGSKAAVKERMQSRGSPACSNLYRKESGEREVREIGPSVSLARGEEHFRAVEGHHISGQLKGIALSGR